MEAISAVFYVLLQVIPTTALVIVPFRKKLKFNVPFTIISLILIYAAIILSSMWFVNRFNNSEARILFSSVCMVVLWAIYSFGYDMPKFQTIFIMIIVKNYMDAANLFSKSITEYHCRNYTSMEQSMQRFYEPFGIGMQLLVLAVTFPMMWMFVKKLLLPLTEATGDFKFWKYLWIIPAAFYLTYRLGIEPGYTGETQVWSANYIFLPYAWAVGTFLTYGTIIFVLLQTVEAAQLEERLHISKMQLQMQAEQYMTLRNNIEQTRRERHDLRHHLVAIKGYADAKDCAGMDNYLDDYLSIIGEEEALSICENYAINSIVSHYFGLAQKHGISTEAAIKLPDPLSVTESDLCIILGNLVENAYEACAAQVDGRRFISVKIGVSGARMIAIMVKNSYSGNITRKDKKFISVKRGIENNIEGVGTSSVMTIAEKYNGVCKFNYEDGIFITNVLLNP